VRTCDLTAPAEELAQALSGIDTVISCVGTTDQHTQINVATAAKAAGVKRFIPCAFITICAPGGIMYLRDEVCSSLSLFSLLIHIYILINMQKEKVYNHIKQIKLPYTIIDVGWWYQIATPRVPSGKLDYAMTLANDELIGDGTTPSAFTDLRDIGRYVARIIVDPRTLNRMVFAYNTVMSPAGIFALVEKLSGEKLEPKYVCSRPGLYISMYV
jgi:NAD(P)H-binding